MAAEIIDLDLADFVEEQHSSPRVAALPPPRNHGNEAEDALIAAALIDPESVVDVCRGRGLRIDHLQDDKHRALWMCIEDLITEGMEVDLVALADALSARKLNTLPGHEYDRGGNKSLLEWCGGMQWLMQLSTPKGWSSLNADQWVDSVLRAASLRAVKRLGEQLAAADASDVDQLIIKAARDLDRLADTASPLGLAPRPITAFEYPDPKGEDVLLGTNRYLCRGGSLILVGTSGMGKSSMDLQAAICWGMGEPFLGIRPVRAMRSLIVQAEDDDGDIGEVAQSIFTAMDLNADQLRQITRNVQIIRNREHTGEAFVRWLSSQARKHEPDLVHINPLLSFAGCDISRQAEMTHFLRGGLNRINAEERWAYILIHHTNKPPTGKDAKEGKSWNEHMYNMAGSADLVNWARAIATLEARKDCEKGQFILRLAKRGYRAGVTVDKPSGKGYDVPVLTDEVMVQHTRKRGNVGNRHNVPLILWEPSAAPPPEPSDAKQTPRKYDDPMKFLKYFPTKEQGPRTCYQLFMDAKQHEDVSRSAFYRIRDELLAKGSIAEDRITHKLYRVD